MRTVRSSSHVYPSMHWAGCVCVSQHALGRGVSARGEGCLPGGEGCLPGSCVSQHALRQTTPPPLWTEFLTHASETRMHSSRMRTACLLTVPQHALPGGVPAQGVYLPRGVPAQVLLSPVNRMTDSCKNITLPQTSFAGGKYYLAATSLRTVIISLQLWIAGTSSTNQNANYTKQEIFVYNYG